MISEKRKSGGLNFDPRTKIILLILTVIATAVSPSLLHLWGIVILTFLFGTLCGRFKSSAVTLLIFGAFYLLPLWIKTADFGSFHSVFMAWVGLFYKVYPCGVMAGLIISTTTVNEFLTAMNKAHISKKIYIPLAVMLRYLPTVAEDWHFIRDAMKLRDVSPTIKGFFTNLSMTIECVYTPLLMSASKASDELTIASVTRGIENPKSRTCLIRIGFKAWDIVAIIIFSAMLILCIIGGIK